jgi:hypothetical protein
MIETNALSHIFCGLKRPTPTGVLLALLALFLGLEMLMPLATAVEVGADEGFELAKATLVLKGFPLYSQVWNDQPPLHTFLIAEMVKVISPAVLGPRLVSLVLSGVLLASFFSVVWRIHGTAAFFATLLLIGSPGFLQLSASCMLEVPALAGALAALSCLVLYGCGHAHWARIVSGLLFGIALQIKFTAAVILPVVAGAIYFQERVSGFQYARFFKALFIFGFASAVVFCAIALALTGPAFFLQFQQSWASHFSGTRSFAFGSPNDFPFDWSIFFKHWDTTIPALLGIGLMAGHRPYQWQILPVIWLMVVVAVFGIHRPWWTYYYLHVSLPLCFCAGVGLNGTWRVLRKQGFEKGRVILFGIFASCALAWVGARVYVQISELNQGPKVHNSVLFNEMNRIKPFAKWMYTDEPVYSFHLDVPMPPDLAVVPLKRMWSGEMTVERIRETLRRLKPEIILLRNQSDEVILGDLLENEYRLIYQDQKHRLYTTPDLARSLD